ncbi:phosphoglycerate dehydrogenase [Alteribacter salitolerans]|uniref:phosphoglycerate dehydrogenase n=1 Tax=Alteribacter salitolerans TaxID=2912333 RepID=UPI001F010FAF|nr:phosphoglycerate dehydrogenase [Alteribacter salitolerans]
MTDTKTAAKTFTVLVSDRLSNEGLTPLLTNPQIRLIEQPITEFTQPDPTIEALIVRSATQVTEDTFKTLPNLKIIGRAGVGVDNIDLEAATKHGVIVINAPDGNTISTCEHTFAMMITLLRNIPQANESVKRGEWNRKKFEGFELYGKTLGIVGFGRIGTELASRAKAFQMNVIVFDPFLTADRAEKFGVTSGSLDDILRESDVITVHTPLTKNTKGLIGQKEFEQAKRGVFILNCARGGIIDEQALVEALETGQVRGAALDVFEDEPLQNHPLKSFDQVILTPHIAASTKEAQRSVAEQVSSEILAYSEGKPIIHGLNFPHISSDAFEKIHPFYELAYKMGKMSSTSMRIPVKEIELVYSGKLAENDTAILTRSFLNGFFKSRVDSYVNDVNVSFIARERGVSLSEKRNQEETGYQSLIKAVITGEQKTFTLLGTSNQDFGLRFVKVDDFTVDFQPSEHQLFIKHNDRPGVIGRVGQLLGNHDVNIATMQVGRKSEGGDAMMILSVDKEMDAVTVEALENVDDIRHVTVLEL